MTTLTFADPLHGWAINACVPYQDIPSVAGLSHCDILATSDGGTTWRVQRTTFGILTNLLFLDGQNGFVYGKDDEGLGMLVLMTPDGGKSWFGPQSGRYGPKLETIAPAGRLTAFGIVAGVLFKATLTPNGEGYWLFDYGSPDCGFSSVSFPTASQGWAAGSGPSGACLFHSDDGGQTWKPVFIGIDSPVLASAISHVSLYGNVLQKQDMVELKLNCDSASIDFYNTMEARLSFPCGGDSITLRTSDGGGTWQFDSQQYACLMSCQTRLYQAGASQQIYYLDLDHAWARTAHQEISWSNDGGKSWNKVSGPELCCDAKEIFFVDPTHGWVPFGDSIAATTDGGRSWTRHAVTTVPP